MSTVLDNPAKFDTPLLAERYDQISDSQFVNGVLLMKEVEVKAGDHVLDIGCGTGRLGEHVLKIIGKNGHFMGLDPSEHRIKLAQQKVKSFSNASFELGSESNLSLFADNSFDVVYLNFVFHHITDKATVLGQINRILKHGGKLGIADPDKGYPSILRTITRDVMQFYGGLYSFDDELVVADELRSLIVSAGLQIIKLNYRKNIRHHSNSLHPIEFMEASDFGNYLSNVPKDLQDSVKTDIAARLGEHQTKDGLKFSGNTIYVIAQKIGKYCRNEAENRRN